MTPKRCDLSMNGDIWVAKTNKPNQTKNPHNFQNPKNKKANYAKYAKNERKYVSC